jgi:hypothetical protein
MIVRAAGAGYRAAQAGHLSLGQLKVMSAIQNLPDRRTRRPWSRAATSVATCHTGGNADAVQRARQPFANYARSVANLSRGGRSRPVGRRRRARH